MVAPSDEIREDTYERDGWVCVSCGRSTLTWQHRIATGSGGGVRPSDASEGCTACLVCNQAFEAHMQTLALVYGWKVRRWVGRANRVPLFHLPRGRWYRLQGKRAEAIGPAHAFEMMRSVYGPEWDQWADTLRAPVGLRGRTE